MIVLLSLYEVTGGFDQEAISQIGSMPTPIPLKAAYAEDPAASRGRKLAEPESRTRTPFARAVLI